MDGDRKYRQNGYQDSERGANGGYRGDRPKPQGPKLPLDVTGPKLPRLVQNVVASRCFSCAMTLAPDTDFRGNCPKCGAALHCCKQCVHFDTGKQFECTQPIPDRIAKKDGKNDCTFFEFRMTVEKDTSPVTYATAAPATTNPGRPNDARKAFEDLFKK